MSVKTQGTHVFVVDTLTSSDPYVLKMACPTAVTGLGGASSQVNDTCLDDLVDESFSPGLGSPGQVNVPFVLKPSEASHQVLFDMWDSKERYQWMIALSDGEDPPTLDSDDQMVPPADRSSLRFMAYVADLNIDIATNEVVRGTLVLQRSGPITRSWLGA